MFFVKAGGSGVCAVISGVTVASCLRSAPSWWRWGWCRVGQQLLGTTVGGSGSLVPDTAHRPGKAPA